MDAGIRHIQLDNEVLPMIDVSNVPELEYQYASIMNALNLDKRLGALERDKQSASA